MSDLHISQEETVRVLKLPFKIAKSLRQLLDGFKWAMHKKNQSAVMIVDGRSGMGKTTLSFQCASYMSKDFSLDNVHFTPEAFLNALSTAKKGETHIFDEAMLLSSRAALSSINRMIVVAMSMIRSKNLFIIFNVNSIFDLDRNLALSRADLLLHCYGDSLTDKGKFLAFFKGKDGRDRIKELYLNGKKLYSYGNPRSNFYTTFSANFILNEDEYEAKKQLAVNKFLQGSTKVGGEKFKNQRNLLIRILYDEKGVSMSLLSELFATYGLQMAENTISECISYSKEPGLKGIRAESEKTPGI